MKLLFTISLFGAVQLFAQTISITNKATKEPVKGVFIYSKEHQNGVISDNKGNVDLSIFEADELINFQHIQFLPFQILKKNVLETGIQLSEKEYTLPPIYYDHPLR